MSRPWVSPVLVTGATGFLGRQVSAALVQRGLAVRALTRHPGAGVPGGTEPAPVRDLSDSAGLRRALAGVTTVVHLAAYVHQPQSRDEEGACRAVNLDGTVALLEHGVEAGIRDFVFISTVKAVGESNTELWTERTRPAPVDAYGRSKLAAEEAVCAAAIRHGLHAPILRLPLVYGPGMKANALRLFDLVARGVPLPLGAVENRRSVLYAGNFLAALMSVVENELGNDLFFVSDGPAIPTPDLVRAIGVALGKPARLMPVPTGLMRAAARVGDRLARVVPWPLTSANLDRVIGSLAVDSSRLEAVAGRPPFTLAEGLSVTAEWYRTRHRA